VKSLLVFISSLNNTWTHVPVVGRGKQFRNEVIKAMIEKQTQMALLGNEPQWDIWVTAAERSLDVSLVFGSCLMAATAPADDSPNLQHRSSPKPDGLPSLLPRIEATPIEEDVVDQPYGNRPASSRGRYR
jgi:hypothetical protein